MRFESKYLIRWGMPGWIVLLWFLVTSYFGDFYNFKLQSDNVVKVFSNLLVFISLGIVIGYIINIFYFSIFWLRLNNRDIKYTTKILEENNITLPSNKNEVYFYIEYLWQSNLKEMEEYKLNYISERYRHLLNRKHELGSLMFCFIFCFPISLAFITRTWFNDMFIGWGFVNFAFFSLSYLSYKYYSKNTDYFMAKTLDELLKKRHST
ncbi:hypothetical protein VBD025_04520 [Virgibacillus flavescens]|uniref:hypothetical protein n=1 Tax=Virgibacillus flavescens TaxID=1611422 RepID=UPI003D343F0C